MMRILGPVLDGLAEMLTEAEETIMGAATPDDETATGALRDIAAARKALQDARAHFMEGTTEGDKAGMECMDRAKSLVHRAIASVEREAVQADVSTQKDAWLRRCPVLNGTLALIGGLAPKYGSAVDVIRSEEFRTAAAALIDADPDAVAWLREMPA